jgi:HSP20 family protein
MTRKDIMVRPNGETAVIHPRSFYEKRVVPPADIIETDANYIVRVDMPGADKSSIDLKIDGDTLRVQGNTSEYHREQPRMFLREIRPTTYEREFGLGRGVNREAVSAEYTDGVLYITIEKNEEMKPREIRIS